MDDELEKEGDGEADPEWDEEQDSPDGDEFDADLVTSARSVGLKPEDFTSEDRLFRETDTRIRRLEADYRGPGEPKDQDALADLSVVLANKGDLDEHLVSALEKLASSTGENFAKLVKRIESSKDQGALGPRVDQLVKVVSNLTAQNIELRFERWIAGSQKRQSVLGKGLTGELDPDGKFVQRRQTVMRQAYKIDGKRKGVYTQEQLFDKAFKKKTVGTDSKNRKVSAGDSGADGPTRIARASGAKTVDMVGGPDESQEHVKNEAAAVVGKYRRNAG